MAIALEEMCSGLGFPEGPVAMDDGSVLFVDIKEETLVRLGTDGKTTTVAKIPGGPNGVAIGPDGAAYVCNNGGVYSFVPYEHEGVEITVPAPIRPNYEGGSVHRVDLESGVVTQLFDSYEGKRLIAPDDIVFDTSGGFWFTDTGIEEPKAPVTAAFTTRRLTARRWSRLPRSRCPTASACHLMAIRFTCLTRFLAAFGRLRLPDLVR